MLKFNKFKKYCNQNLIINSINQKTPQKRVTESYLLLVFYLDSKMSNA